MGAGLAVVCGLALRGMPLGDRWVNASYDYLFLFGARAPKHRVALILMDNESYERCGQTRDEPWSRGLHAQLLNRLADDKCRLVVFDSFFEKARDPASDQALAEAMRRHESVVLMARLRDSSLQDVGPTVQNEESAGPRLPAEQFLKAANNNYGVALVNQDPDLTARRQWPFPAPGPVWLRSLPWTAALVAGAQLSSEPQEQWLRYYGEHGAWDSVPSSCMTAAPTTW